MRVISVNVAQPRPVMIQEREVLTGIYKEPVSGRVRVTRNSLEGDGQADLRVHGGEYKAIYAYPFEHYTHWQTALRSSGGLLPGTFGENLTIMGLLEQVVCVGDVLRIGSAVLQVTHPRLPCFKLAHKIGRPTFVKEFLASGRSGFYLRVIEEGEVGAGDHIEILKRDPSGVTVRGLLGITDLKEQNPELAKRAMNLEALPPSWREDVKALLQT